jgi:hypothetical protein
MLGGVTDDVRDYAPAGLTLPELAATRDAVARDVDERDDPPEALRSALAKLTRYHDQRAKGR